jgi:hypothetical protein
LSLKRTVDDKRGYALVISAKATVTRADETSSDFDVLVTSLEDGSPPTPRASNVKLKVTVQPKNIDAQVVSPGADVDLYLTFFEIMMGDLCRPPAKAAKPGTKWKEEHGSIGSEEFEFVSLEKDGNAEMGSFKRWIIPRPGEGLGGDLESTKTMRLRMDDAFTGTCHVVNKLTMGGTVDTQIYDIAVTREP